MERCLTETGKGCTVQMLVIWLLWPTCDTIKKYSTYGASFNVTKKWLVDKNKMRKHSMCFMYMCFIDFQRLIMKKMLTTFSSLHPSLTFPYISSFYVQPIWKVSFTIRIVKLCIVNLICLQAPHLWGKLVQGKEMSLQNLYSVRLWFVTFYQYSTHKATGFLLFYGRLNANDLTIQFLSWIGILIICIFEWP